MLIGLLASFPLAIINHFITNRKLRLIYSIIPGMFIQFFVFGIGNTNLFKIIKTCGILF